MFYVLTGTCQMYVTFAVCGCAKVIAKASKKKLGQQRKN